MQTTSPIQHPLANAAPETIDAIDHLDPLICTREELQDLIESVNDVQIRAFLWGIVDTREFLATVTGRPF